jgi:hypothetical protein
LISSESKKKSSRWLLWLFIGVVVFLFLIFMRSGFMKFGEDGTESGRTQQNSADMAKSPSSEESDADGISRESSQAPYSGGASTFEEPATPVSFKGVVLNEAGRVPIGGAHVRIVALSSHPDSTEKTTGADGTFIVDAPPAYRYELNVDAEGFSSFRNDTFVIRRPNYNMEILLTRTLQLRGRVLDPQSQGIPYAKVSISAEGGEGLPIAPTTTDGQGGFSISSAMLRGGRLRLEASHAGYDSIGAVAVKMPTEEEIILRMKPASATGSLGGSVKDAALRPIAAAKISILDANSKRAVSEVLTDQKGEYRLAKIREGNFPVRCSADGFAQTDNSQSTVTIITEKESRLDFSMKAGQQILGIVVNQKGEPVPNATVMYGPASLVRIVNTAENKVSISRSGTEENGGNTGDSGEFGSRGGGGGRAFGGRSGNASDSGGFGSRAGNMGGGRTFGSRGGNTGDGGGFSARGGSPGGSGGFGPRGGNAGDSRGFGPSGGNIAGSASFGSRGGNMEDGSAPSSRGEGRADVVVFSSRDRSMGDGGMLNLGMLQNFASIGNTTTDIKGRFQILGLSEEPYQVSIQHRDYIELNTQLQPSSQQQTLTLDSALSLRGTASNVQGVPIVRFSLMLRSTSTTKRFAKSYSFTTVDGHFEVRGLTPDKYTVILRISNGENYTGTLDLQSSTQVLLLTGEVSESGNELRGRRAGERGDARGDWQGGVRGGRGRGGDVRSLTIVKAG